MPHRAVERTCDFTLIRVAHLLEFDAWHSTLIVLSSTALSALKPSLHPMVRKIGSAMRASGAYPSITLAFCTASVAAAVFAQIVGHYSSQKSSMPLAIRVFGLKQELFRVSRCWVATELTSETSAATCNIVALTQVRLGSKAQRHNASTARENKPSCKLELHLGVVQL